MTLLSFIEEDGKHIITHFQFCCKISRTTFIKMKTSPWESTGCLCQPAYMCARVSLTSCRHKMIKCFQMICFVLLLLLTIPEWSESFTSTIKICTPEDEVFTLKRVVRDILQQKLELYDEVYTMLLYQQFCGY